MRSWFAPVLAIAASIPTAWSFCGFYVAQEPGSLFNKSSKVVIARDGDHTVLTMANDYQGDPAEFGLVVPVPQEIKRGMVRVADSALIDRIDQYTVPRLAQYFDEDPCPEPYARDYEDKMSVDSTSARRGLSLGIDLKRKDKPTVKIEQEYTVDEYAITVIKATNGSDLETWLRERGYQVPDGATAVLESYIKQGMHFFLAKIDISAQRKLGLSWPRPLRISYDSPKFMLPVRLGTLNANGAQDLVIYLLTRKGRVETTNYRTARLPTDIDIPEYIADGEFPRFYESLFDRAVQRDGMSHVYLEYSWPLSIPCDPCSSSRLTPNEFEPLGAEWTSKVKRDYHGGSVEMGHITRLHVRYDAAHFPEDLVFQETADTETWQARYVVHRRFTGDTSCEDGQRYEASLHDRQRVEVGNLITLTGWSPDAIWPHIPM